MTVPAKGSISAVHLPFYFCTFAQIQNTFYQARKLMAMSSHSTPCCSFVTLYGVQLFILHTSNTKWPTFCHNTKGSTFWNKHMQELSTLCFISMKTQSALVKSKASEMNKSALCTPVRCISVSRLTDFDMTPTERRDVLDVNEPVVLCRDLPADTAPSQHD